MKAFISRWQAREGRQERANYQMFLGGLCRLLGLPEPDPADATHERNDYVFERVVTRHRDDGDALGRIDLYRRSSLVLEAKQSRIKGGKKEVAGKEDLFVAGALDETRGRRGADRAWDVLMLNAFDDAWVLGLLSSRIHTTWALRAGGWLGIGNDSRYSKSRVFDTFPFPDLDVSLNLKAEIGAVAEELDAFRKERQKEHPGLTLTQMYNVLEKLKTIEAAQLPSPHERSEWRGGVLGGGPTIDVAVPASRTSFALRLASAGLRQWRRRSRE